MATKTRKLKIRPCHTKDSIKSRRSKKEVHIKFSNFISHFFKKSKITSNWNKNLTFSLSGKKRDCPIGLIWLLMLHLQKKEEGCNIKIMLHLYHSISTVQHQCDVKLYHSFSTVQYQCYVALTHPYFWHIVRSGIDKLLCEICLSKNLN